MAQRFHRLSIAASVLALAAPGAEAHVGVGDASGFAHGFSHPIGGIDHVLAMVAVGVFAAQLGGKALWLAPSAFVAMMAVGGVLGIAGIELPFVEFGIAVSVIVLGAAIALHVSMPTAFAMGLVGFFAIFHGHAHGAEMPADASGLGYAFGFVLATALLHAVGIGIGLGLGRLANARTFDISRIAGSLIAVAGLGILGGYV
jgi:urease accessory protein